MRQAEEEKKQKLEETPLKMLWKKNGKIFKAKRASEAPSSSIQFSRDVTNQDESMV